MHLDEGKAAPLDRRARFARYAGPHAPRGCAACREHRDRLKGNALFTQRLLAQNAPAFDAQTAVARVAEPRRRPAWMTPAVALAAAAAVVLALAFTPLGGIASQWLTIFEPKQFVPLEITSKDSSNCG